MFDKGTGLISDNKSHNYGIDALKIVSMLMIVTLHVLGHGGILNSSESTNYWIAWLLEIAAYGAVNVYALISGYLGVYSKYKISNLATLWCRVAFYSISITVIFRFAFHGEIGIKTILSALFPVLSNRYWYFTAYALLFLFIPFLNEGLNRLSKKKLATLLLAVVTVTSILRPFTSMFSNDAFTLAEGYSVWWLMILYLIGGYIRKYGLLQKVKSHRTTIFLFAFFAFVLATWLYKLFIQLAANRMGVEIGSGGLFCNYLSITILGAAVSLLLAFEQMNFHAVLTKVIAFLAPLSFSVYLIHENSLIRNKLIVDRFIWIAALPAYQMIPLIIGIVISIYLLCSFVDVIRQYLFKKLKVKEKLNALELSIKQKMNGVR